MALQNRFKAGKFQTQVQRDRWTTKGG